jgi:uncharacterized protein (TIGR00288 family)
MSSRTAPQAEARVAVLVDCDNTSPDVLEYALRVVAQSGRVVLRRGYGNHNTLAHKWREALVRLAFTPCLQFQYAAGKNTADIALALDALEALLDGRADTFWLVTCDSDFTCLCRKLRERGAAVYIVGDVNSPDALRQASDQFHEWVKPASPAQPVPCPSPAQPVPYGALSAQISDVASPSAPSVAKPKPAATKPAAPTPVVKRQHSNVVEAVKLLAADAPEGRVPLSQLGDCLKGNDPDFSPKAYGHRTLGAMLREDALLSIQQEASGSWTVSLAAPAGDAADNDNNSDSAAPNGH